MWPAAMRAMVSELETISMDINMGPQHPSTHGVFRMVLTVAGERVVGLESIIGYMHRGGEKLSENMDYRQGIGYQDRTDYLAAFNNEQTYCMAAEKLAGIAVPERAEYIRVIMCELNRIASHFMFMGAFGEDAGVFGSTFMFAWREREGLLDLFEKVSGDRMMYNYFRIGGVAWDLPEGFERECREVLKECRQGMKDISGLFTDNEVFLARSQGIGVISAADAISWGMSGPMLRASGLAHDLRRAEPYSIYDRFQFDIPTGENGDVYDRYLVRLREMEESARIIEQALDNLPDGPIMPERTPRILRPPVGEVYMRTENPRGEYGIYLVSRGAAKPWRLKIRSACFSNLAALGQMAVGHYIADAVIILGSVDIVLCEVDR